MIVHDLIQSPFPSFQPSHSPANANNLAFAHFEAEGLFTLWCAFPLVEPISGNQAPTDFQRIAERRLRVSDFAFIVFAAMEASFDQFGIKPQRIVESCRIGFFGCWRITGTGWVGAMLLSGVPVVLPIGSLELFLNDFLPPRQSVAPAHGVRSLLQQFPKPENCSLALFASDLAAASNFEGYDTGQRGD